MVVARRSPREISRDGGIDAVLSANVERSSIDARPLVRVYTPREVRQLLSAAGFRTARTIVRQFRWPDVPFGGQLQWLPAPSGRRFGWYVTGYGTR